MPEFREIDGGEFSGIIPRTAFSTRPSHPHITVVHPGSLDGTVAVYGQIDTCSRSQFGKPEPVAVKVQLLNFDGNTYMSFQAWWGPEVQASKPDAKGKQELVPETTAKPLDVYPIKFRRTKNSPTITGLARLFQDHHIELRPGVKYVMDTEVVRHKTKGYLVLANWTTAKTLPKGKRVEAQTAASDQK